MYEEIWINCHMSRADPIFVLIILGAEYEQI